MACLSCSRGFHDECGDPCCCPDMPEQASFSEKPPTGPIGRREISTSGGRKEAARLYPLNREASCEWQGLANVGGGLYPIVGCAVGKQQARHHGPVKNTTENHGNNIHRICHTCHNRWHGKNDPVYDEAEYYNLPHKPRVATPKELIRSEPEPVAVIEETM